MTLGQKIKEARIAKNMTQKELVGDYITRNMLSKIENDSATPSVRTIEFLAKQLGKPVGFFLDQESILPHQQKELEIHEQEIALGKEEFRQGHYEACIRRLERIDFNKEPDADEAQILLAHAYYCHAESCIGLIPDHMIQNYITEGLKCNRMSMYYDQYIELAFVLIGARIAKADAFQEAVADFERLCSQKELRTMFYVLKVESLLNDHKIEEAFALKALLETQQANPHDLKYLSGLFLIAEKNYSAALDCLKSCCRISEKQKPDRMLRLYAAAEFCCKKLEDIHGAYYYATKQLELTSRKTSS